jgi:hypothetical protein
MAGSTVVPRQSRSITHARSDAREARMSIRPDTIRRLDRLALRRLAARPMGVRRPEQQEIDRWRTTY